VCSVRDTLRLLRCLSQRKGVGSRRKQASERIGMLFMTQPPRCNRLCHIWSLRDATAEGTLGLAFPEFFVPGPFGCFSCDPAASKIQARSHQMPGTKNSGTAKPSVPSAVASRRLPNMA